MANDNPIENMNQESLDSYELTYIQEVEEAASRLISLANRTPTGKFSRGIHQALSKQHRTIQQSFWRGIIELADRYKDNRFDARNEASVVFCKDLSDFCKEKHVFLPYI